MVAASSQARTTPRTTAGHCHHRGTESGRSTVRSCPDHPSRPGNSAFDVRKHGIHRSCRHDCTCPPETAHDRCTLSGTARRLHGSRLCRRSGGQAVRRVTLPSRPGHRSRTRWTAACNALSRTHGSAGRRLLLFRPAAQLPRPPDRPSLPPLAGVRPPRNLRRQGVPVHAGVVRPI